MTTPPAVWLFLAMCFVSSVVIASPFYPTTEKKKCTNTKVMKLTAADCHGINLGNVPQNLYSRVEVLDLSFNRIRKLQNTDFDNYPYIQFLYLDDNLISQIEANTFSNLQYLEVLNVSWNAIQVIPPELFHLPHLRKLTLDFNNLNKDAMNEIQSSPIMPSLKILSMSHCTLHEFPPLMKFPHIEFLNVSGNFLTTITAEQLAHACLLKIIDVSDNVRLPNMPRCSCAGLKSWTILKEIDVKPSLQYICSPMQDETMQGCTNNVSLSETDHVYNTCQATYVSLQTTAAWTKYGIATGICLASIVVVAALLLLYCRMCRFPRSNDELEPRTRDSHPSDNKDLLSFTNNTDT